MSTPAPLDPSMASFEFIAFVVTGESDPFQRCSH